MDEKKSKRGENERMILAATHHSNSLHFGHAFAFSHDLEESNTNRRLIPRALHEAPGRVCIYIPLEKANKLPRYHVGDSQS